MGLDFEYPWALLLIPAGIAAVMWIDRRYRTRAPSLKRRVTLWARLLLCVVLALAVAGPSLLVASGRTSRWLLLDVSDSAAPSGERMQSAVEAALARLPRGEEAGVIVFGGEAMVETPLSENPVFTGVHVNVSGDGSDLDGALLLANALLPADGAGGVTVLSDGRAEASRAVIDIVTARGIKVDTLAYETAEAADAQLSELIAPAGAYEGQSISVEAVIDATAAMTGSLVLYQNGEPTTTREVKLQKGENRFAFTDVARQAGVVTYEARLLLQEDAQSRNNSMSAYVRVTGAPNVLLVSQSDGVESLLASAGMKVNAVRPGELPQTAEGYLSYDAVVLNNIDFDDATERQWQALSAAVRTLGRGLVTLGGDSSYALGGYRGTVLEELLPVRIDVRDKLQMPALSLVIAIDKSGSMTMGQFGTSRIEVAKEAAMSAIEVLIERDQVGVIGFDDTAKWVVPFGKVEDIGAVESMIGTLRADGGTAFYSALSEAFEALIAAETPQKHVIFLSDGEPGDTGFQDVALAMGKAGITLTTVAVGSGADTRLMSLLATLGGGRAYEAGEFDDIPKIFTKETMLAGGSYVQNRAFTPVVTESSALTGFDGFPTLTGYLTAVEKPTANVSMTSDTEDPLLAWWNAGAGRTVAWMSDAEGAWTEAFLRWTEAPSFFGGLVAKALPGAGREGVLTAAADGDKLRVRYETEGAEEAELHTLATIVAPDGTEQTVELAEVEAGVYEGAAEAKAQGAYALRVTQSRDGETVRSQEGGAVKGYAHEYDLRDAADKNLGELSLRTGGRTLAPEDDFWSAPVTGSRARRRLTALLCVLAVILLLCDIALRKLPWEDAVLKLIGRRGARADASPGRVREPAPKAGAAKAPSRRESKAAQEKARKEAAAQTADALLSAKKAREKR